MTESRNANARTNGLYGAHGRALMVDISTGEHHVETIPPATTPATGTAWTR